MLREETMPKDLTWDDPEDVGILLSEKHPNTDPLTVRYTDLHRYVAELSDFKDDPKKSSESRLEAYQMAWHVEYEARGSVVQAVVPKGSRNDFVFLKR